MNTPDSSRPLRIGFIGAGRLATGLGLALSRAGQAVAAAASRRPQTAQRLADQIHGCQAVTAQEVADRAGLVFVTTPDDAIAGVAAGLSWRAGQSVVHCSGAGEVSLLAPAERAGASIGGFHPLQTFTDPQAALASLPGCTISIEAADAALAARLAGLAAAVQCRSIRLPPGCRARYHASGGYASQFVNALLREATDIWKSFGVGEEEAVQALLPLLKGTIASIEKAGVAGGMPGPVSRGDVGTVARHVQDLAGLGENHLALYCQLALRTVRLAEERGSLDADKAGALRALLRPSR